MISAPRSSRSRCVTAFTAPCVPTAMNAGVFTTPCGVVSTPRRAAPCVCVTSNRNINRYIRGIVKKLRVGIIYGGRSGEHEVSIASAAAVVQNLDKQRYEAIPIRIEKDGRWIIADRLPVSSSAAEVIEQSRATHGAAARTRRARSAPRCASRRRTDHDDRARHHARQSPALRSTWYFRCFMVRTAKTARFRDCSSSRTSPMSARACSPRRSAWTKRSRSWCLRREGCRRRNISSCFATNGRRRRRASRRTWRPRWAIRCS